MALDTARTIATLRGLTQRFDIVVQGAEPYYPQKSTTFISGGRDEGYGGLGNVSGMREWLGDRIFNSLNAASFTIANKLWESSLAIEKVDIEDDRLNMYGPIFDQLGVEATFHPDELMFNLQMAGDSTVCMDGQYFYDVDHSWGKSGIQSNKLSCSISVPAWAVSTAYTAGTTVRANGNQYICMTSGTSASTGAGPSTTAVGITDGTVTWNYLQGSIPSEDDCRRAYWMMVNQLLGFKRDSGKPFHRPTLAPITDLVLEVPPALTDVFNKALLKQYINWGQSNLIYSPPAKIVPVAYFTDPLSIYLHRVGQPLKPFAFQARRPLARQMKGLDDREFKDVKFMTDARYNVGFLAWWNSVKLTFS